MKKLVALSLAASALAGCMHPYAQIGSGPGPMPKPYELVQCPGEGPYQPDDADFRFHRIGAPVSRSVYHAWFPGGRIDCGYMDRVHSSPQAMVKGDSQVVGMTDFGADPASSGALALHLKAPDPIPKDAAGQGQTSSMGVFSTGLDLGPTAVFTLSGTFQAPNGPHLAPSATDSNAWAVTLVARTGAGPDLGSETRLGVTFKVKNNLAILTVQETGSDTALGTAAVPDELYRRFFGLDGQPPEPFTLQLYVDRQKGKGVASLVPSKPAVKIDFDMRAFGPGKGPTITAAGPVLANCCSPGQPVYVEVTEFRILFYYDSRSIRIEPPVPNGPPINPL